MQATFTAHGVPSVFFTDWVPLLLLFLSFSHVAMQVQTASNQRYYEPAAILLVSMVLKHLFLQDFKRSTTSIHFFDFLRFPLSRCKNDRVNSQLINRRYSIATIGTYRELLASYFALYIYLTCLHGFVFLTIEIF